MESSLLYVNDMGLYIRKTNNDYKISNFLGDIKTATLYGDTVFVNENPSTKEEFVYYVHNSHYHYHQNDALDYDFEVGLDEDGHPYLDFIFYDFGGFNGDVYVETNFGKKKKNHGRGYAICYWETNETNAGPDSHYKMYTWMSTDDIQLNKTYRLYICFICGYKYCGRFAKNGGGCLRSDWIVHLNVRLGFNGSFTNYEKNSQLKNFKDYKTISYGINDEYEL